MTDAFFVLFEHVSKARSWSDVDCALMLQCALTGKSQEAYSFIKAKDSFSYAKIKSAVLKAYGLVAEARIDSVLGSGKGKMAKLMLRMLAI